ncbi:MAG: pyruvate kinase alpha/beta domain-containing protein [Armatimonadota bacterium]
MIYFEKAGEHNTEDTLKAAKEEALKRDIKHVVIASTRGNTARLAAEFFKGAGLNLVIVTHNTGFKEPGVQEFDPGLKNDLEARGIKVHTGTMVLRNLGRSIKNILGYCQEELVNTALRMFGQGTKVCIEIAASSCDAGLVPPEDIIAVAGTGKGADTAVIIKADSSNNFMEMKVRSYIAKPREF